MSSKSQLGQTGYGTVNDVPPKDESSRQYLNESWVETHVILPSKVVIENSSTIYKYDEDERMISSSQQPVYRDKGFALLFLLHLITFITIGLVYGSYPNNIGTTNPNPNQTASTTATNATMTTIIACSFALSYIVTHITTTLFIPNYSTIAVKASLYLSMFLNITMLSMVFISFPNIFTLLLACICIMWNWWYVHAVQIFIPFAAANLKLATQAISTNAGVYVISFLFGILGLLWMSFWIYTVNGVGLFGTSSDDTQQYKQQQHQDDYYSLSVDNAVIGLKGFSLLLSLYWTMNVLSNIVQTTIAGVTGTWCFDKNNASKCCSSAVTQSLYRSCTYSFGSICFGSLLNAIITTLRVMAQWARDRSRESHNNGAAFLYCILTCILSLIEDIIEYFNQWAFVFVGIWGLDYLESGKRVLELFEARGVTAIISNGLASYVLMNMVIFSSLVCGLFGYGVGRDMTSFWYV